MEICLFQPHEITAAYDRVFGDICGLDVSIKARLAKGGPVITIEEVRRYATLELKLAVAERTMDHMFRHHLGMNIR